MYKNRSDTLAETLSAEAAYRLGVIDRRREKAHEQEQALAKSLAMAKSLAIIAAGEKRLASYQERLLTHPYALVYYPSERMWVAAGPLKRFKTKRALALGLLKLKLTTPVFYPAMSEYRDGEWHELDIQKILEEVKEAEA